MFEEDRPLRDQLGVAVAPGEFVELLETRGNILKGPLKYEGWHSGTRVWSVGGQSFITSAIEACSIRRLNWRRWRKPKERADQFWDFLSQQAKSVE
jgi:hypothetical protein